MQKRRQRVQRRARGSHGHHRKCGRIQPARFFIKAQRQILRHRAGSRTVVKRHHEYREKDHGRNRTYPIELRGHDAVFRTRCGHTDHLLSPEVGREKC